jgi:hypothetical protein
MIGVKMGAIITNDYQKITFHFAHTRLICDSGNEIGKQYRTFSI